MVDQSSLTSPWRKIEKVASASTFDNQIEGSPTQNRHVAQGKSIGKLNIEKALAFPAKTPPLCGVPDGGTCGA